MQRDIKTVTPETDTPPKTAPELLAQIAEDLHYIRKRLEKVRLPSWLER